jgi:guanylate kinase
MQTHKNPPIERRGLMFVLSSPSGAGKSTISRKLLDQDDHLTMSVSYTTRKRRPGEASGRDYYFVSEPEFNEAIANNDFLEWAKVFGSYYGTPKIPVEEALNEGIDVLFDIDWQGTQQLGQIARGDLVTVFILPPSWGELERRLVSRAQDPQEIVTSRMAKAADEISHWAEYDYIIINDDLEHATQHVKAILHAERLKRSRQRGLSQFVKQLCQKVI